MPRSGFFQGATQLHDGVVRHSSEQRAQSEAGAVQVRQIQASQPIVLRTNPNTSSDIVFKFI